MDADRGVEIIGARCVHWEWRQQVVLCVLRVFYHQRNRNSVQGKGCLNTRWNKWPWTKCAYWTKSWMYQKASKWQSSRTHHPTELYAFSYRKESSVESNHSSVKSANVYKMSSFIFIFYLFIFYFLFFFCML
ncbi:uncharacterized protein LOC144003821 isoform X1 [Festucalex cinctus]